MSADLFATAARSQLAQTSASPIPLEIEKREPGPEGDDTASRVPDLLEWMGRSFGDAVQRAKYPFEGLLQALPAAVYTTDADGCITFYNEAAVKLWGCRPEIGKSEFCGSWKLYWPDGTPLPHDECPMALALREKRPVRGMEAVAERPDGTRVPFLPYPTPLFDESGALIGAINMLVDISDRRQMEERLRESEAGYRGIFESARVAVWEEDFSAVADTLDALRRQGIEDLREYFAAQPDRLTEAIASVRIHNVNAYAVELFEAERKEALVHSLADVFLPETRSIFIEELVALWEGRRQFESEAVLRTLKGRRLDAIFTMAFEGARFERTIVSILDITARKAAELATQRLAAVVESSDDAIISKDLNGVITSWNRGAARLFGYTAEEAIGQPIMMLFPPDRLDEEAEIVGRVRRGERVEHYETVRRRKDGCLVEISLTVSPVRDADGKILGASKIARDITEQKRAQERQKLIVSEMKHRIKNSLATIQAIASQTLNQHAEERDAFIARLHALDRAHDVLTAETWERASLSVIVNRALEPFQQEHRERIRVDGPDHLWLGSSKGVMVAMVIHELATNAIKHGALSNGTGQISVTWDRTAQPDIAKLVWHESGGPEVTEPKKRGFGSHLIERAFGGQLGAARLVFNPSGLMCTLEITL